MNITKEAATLFKEFGQFCSFCPEIHSIRREIPEIVSVITAQCKNSRTDA
jgi:hypothetical protein